MGQKEKAREIVDALYHFDTVTGLDGEGIMAAADRAAKSSKKLGGGVVRSTFRENDKDSFDSSFALKGPAGAVSVMTFTISGRPQPGGGIKVSMRVGEFLFQKGSLGMKPTINGRNMIGKFVEIFRTELAAVKVPSTSASGSD